jgi:hypothetical protein
MTTDNNEQLRKKLLGKLKGLEMVLGCTTEEFLQVLSMEIGARLPQPAGTGDIDEIANKVIARLPDFKAEIAKMSNVIEAHLAVKLDEVMSLISKGMGDNAPDSKSIIAGVAAVLEPKLAEASKAAAEQVFRANHDALMVDVGKAMEEKYNQLQAQAPTQDPNAAGPGGRPGMAGGLLQMAMTNPEGLKGLAEAVKAVIDVFKPPVAASAALNDFQRFMNFHDLMTKIEKRTASSDDIAQGIGKVFGATAPAIQAPAQAPAAK